jgi:hypothetical protein
LKEALDAAGTGAADGMDNSWHSDHPADGVFERWRPTSPVTTRCLITMELSGNGTALIQIESRIALAAVTQLLLAASLETLARSDALP